MMVKTHLKLITQPQDYFRELVTEALHHQKVNVQPETEYYLVNLLFQFMKADHLNPDTPLAMMLKEALEESHPQAQLARFKYIGDVSLYKAGFFQESLNKRLVDVDYYINMGGTAYRQVQGQTQEDTLKSIYAELSEKFSSFVDVFSEVSEKTSQKTEKDILRTYELWLKTKSEKAAKTLKNMGIIPNETLKKNYQ